MQDLRIFNESFLIVGGPNTNKSEVSRLLSKELGFKLINLDRDKHQYLNDFTEYDFSIYQTVVDMRFYILLNIIKGDLQCHM